MESRPSSGSFSLAIIALVAGGVALIHLKAILMPLAVAFFLVNIAGPSVTFLRKKGAPSGFAVLAIIVVTAVTTFLLARIFYTQVPGFIEDYPAYRQTLLKDLESLVGAMPDRVRGVLDLDWSGILPRGAQAVGAALGELLGALKTLMIILLFMVFLLLERDPLMRRVRAAFDPGRGARILAMMEKIRTQTENYIVGKTLTSLMTGGAATLLLWILGVKFFFVWGLLTFLLNFIPYIGSIIATVLPLLVSLAQMHMGQAEHPFTWTRFVILAMGLISIQGVVGNLLEPRLLGQRLQLSPLIVFLSFMIWGWLWGLPGMILSVPIMATVKIVLENVETLKPFGVLISMGSASEKAQKRGG